ncbi:hypothetical protein F5876DRAFT_66399 [Lentinula aff. lateritia]|uniref:Uncharacterized protein n=1 Tax=Lentinula aff. lateritia TaxID=2804960 RepID=A0ACC1TY17_9AGAR|nr:hypothetical protein F5876DRAFT_66399 [Lentinula aff. lateritia]
MLRKLFRIRPGYNKLSFKRNSTSFMCFIEFEDVNAVTKTIDEVNPPRKNVSSSRAVLSVSHTVKTPLIPQQAQKDPEAVTGIEGTVYPRGNVWSLVSYACPARCSNALPPNTTIISLSFSIPPRLQSRRFPFLPSSVSMRRSSEELQQRYEMRETRGISNSDGQGYLYAYVDIDSWKVGMTSKFARRQEEWDKNCPYPWRIWLPPIRVANRRRAAFRSIGTPFTRNGVSSLPANVLSTLSTNTYREIYFLRNMAGRLKHNRVSYLFEGCCFVKLTSQ